MKTFIFTEIINAGPIGRIMLKSFQEHHPNMIITVFGTHNEFDDTFKVQSELQSPFINFIPIDHDYHTIEAFKTGHLGTAMIFARAWNHALSNGYTHLLHIDSDVYFKRESISLIEDEFKAGFDIVGSRRCYEKNPGGAQMQPGTPDAISTYFTGWNMSKLNIGEYSHDQLVCMWQGAYNPQGFPVLDFADPVCFEMLKNGATIKFLDSNLIGGQDENGSKVNNYKSNMNFDCGCHLVHLGGVGSGYAYCMGKSNPESSYAQWSIGRWNLFSKLFYDTDVYNDIKNKEMPGCQINDQGRWVNGNYDWEILDNAIKDIFA